MAWSRRASKPAALRGTWASSSGVQPSTPGAVLAEALKVARRPRGSIGSKTHSGNDTMSSLYFQRKPDAISHCSPFP
eukprot:10615800-Alexandrium_andersonii.AAC.1